MSDVLFVMDPPETFDPRADSTYVMITEAIRRGHRPFGTGVAGSAALAETTML